MTGEGEVLVVGSAARDVVHDDPRGWRLGGGVTYGGLTLARLGLRPRVLVGVDRLAADAEEPGHEFEREVVRHHRAAHGRRPALAPERDL